MEMFEVYFGKKDGLPMAALTCTPRVFFLSTYGLGVGLVRFIFCEFLRIALVAFIERGTPCMDSGRGSFRATFAKLSPTFRKISVPNP